MAKIIDYDFRKGSIVNKGTLATTEVLSNATIQNAEKGMAFVSTQAGSNTLQINTTLNGTYSVELAVRVDSVAALSGYLFDARYNSGTGYLYTSTYAVISASAGTVYRDGIARNTLPPLNTWMHIVVTGIPITCTRLMFNSNSSAGQGCIGKYAFFRVYEGTLTAQEVTKLYADYQNPTIEGKPKRGFLVNKPNDLSKEVNNTLGADVVSGWDFTNWTPTSTGSVTDNNTFVANAAGDGIYKVLVTVGKRYRINIQGDMTGGAGCQFAIWNSTSISNLVGVVLNNSGTFNQTLDFTAVATQLHFRVGTNSATVNVSKFTIQELSGLVAAYNMKPNGLTLTDISGNGNNAILYTGSRQGIITQDGLQFNRGGYYAVQPFVNTPSSAFTVSTRLRLNNTGREQHFCGITNIQIYSSSTEAVFLNGGGANTVNTPANTLRKNIWSTITLVFTNPGGYIYIDGVLAGSNPTMTLSATRTNLYIGTIYTGNATYDFDGEIADLKIYNRVLSLQEIKDYHNSFAKQPYLVEDFSDLPCDGNAVVPRDWTKISGSFKGGEISLAQGSLIPNGYFESGITGYGLTAGTGGNATLSYETASPITGVGSLRVTQTTQPSEAFRPHITIALTKTTEIDKTYSVRFKSRLLSGAVKFSAGNGVQLGLASSQAYLVNQVFSGTQQWSVTVKSTAVGTNMFLYFNGSLSAFDLLLDDIEVVEIDPLPTLTKGSKYLECVTAGIIAIPSNQIAGTWEWDWYKGADANTSKFNFVAPNFAGDGLFSMTFYVDNSENLLLRVSNSTIASTATSYFRNFTWYRVRVTRTTAGSWTMLIKGGAFTPTAGYDGWTLISTTGGTGTNPIINTVISSSIYLLFDIDAGDRFTNLKLTNGVII